MYSRGTNRVKTVEVASAVIRDHFTKIADSYRYLRATDPDPIAFIARKLRGLDRVEAADVGCGDGRYNLLLFHYLGDKLRLACVDPNHGMLETLDACMKDCGISNFITINSRAESLPLPGGALDCVFAFNSIHHFNPPGFLRESARILKSDGYLFVYTRLREQNKRNIWGLHFPKFHRKETRLHSLEAFMRTVEAVPALWVESIQFFKYRRVATLEQLVERARAHHYSTFVLYSPEELEKAITGFVKNIKHHFKDVQRVVWLDEYALFTIRKDGTRC
jgi:ubiquinone/menaquinone biosynthesis C-methylase UbiE